MPTTFHLSMPLLIVANSKMLPRSYDRTNSAACMYSILRLTKLNWDLDHGGLYRWRENSFPFLIARLARSDPRNSFVVFFFFFSALPCAICSILVYYFVMFSFWVLTCLRIVSIRIILNLNKFRHVSTCSDMFENRMNRDNSYHIKSEQV